MKPEEIYFWQLIAESIAKENPSVYCFIMHRLEDPNVKGFSLNSGRGKLVISCNPEVDHLVDEIYMPIDFPLEYQDPAGTFEGLPIDLEEK